MAMHASHAPLAERLAVDILEAEEEREADRLLQRGARGAETRTRLQRRTRWWLTVVGPTLVLVAMVVLLR